MYVNFRALGQANRRARHFFPSSDRRTSDMPASSIHIDVRTGGFAMLMGDLLTLRQQKLPVKVILFKNDSLALVELDESGGHRGLGHRSAQS
jgi:Thiamine pyrophosphate enzyme, C-terminal TPP binding domain